MILGKSSLHVKQGVGAYISIDQLGGYYNDLRKKVSLTKVHNIDDIPLTVIETGKSVYFPTAIFQYGLGLYDLYLDKQNAEYFNAFLKISDWALNNQNENGSWNNFYFSMPDNPYSCMSQGEGASLLLRAYHQTKNSNYLFAAKNAIDFMLIDKKYGGVSDHSNGQLILLEYTNKDVVLNGWIFGIFGLIDIIKVTDDKLYKEAMKNSIETLSLKIKEFDNGYWSIYDLSNKIIASRFYHSLHIAQLQALFLITKNPIFSYYEDLFKKYDRNLFYRIRSFITKVIQKILE